MAENWVRLVFDEDVPAEIIRCWHRVDWEKRSPRMLRDLFSGSPAPAPIQTGWQSSQPRRLDRLRDVHLIWSNFFIAGDRCTSIYDDPRTAVSGIVDWPELAETAGIHRRGEDFVVSRSRLQSAEHIAGRTMHATSNEPHNWGMWLLYVLPAVVHFAENCHAYDKLLVFADRPNMKEMLWLLGLKTDDVVFHDCSQAYYFESIDVFRQPRREFFVAPEARAVFAKLREKGAGSVAVPSARRIYVGRRHWTAEMGGYRALMNECELENRLAAMGHRPINPECLGPEAQIELFGSAQRIVVLGGAGLFNAVFCRPGTKIVDIESTRDHLENHSTILSSMDADYGIILGQVDQSDPTPHNKRWRVDVEQATDAIAEFMD